MTRAETVESIAACSLLLIYGLLITGMVLAIAKPDWLDGIPRPHKDPLVSYMDGYRAGYAEGAKMQYGDDPGQEPVLPWGFATVSVNVPDSAVIDTPLYANPAGSLVPMPSALHNRPKKLRQWWKP